MKRSMQSFLIAIGRRRYLIAACLLILVGVHFFVFAPSAHANPLLDILDFTAATVEHFIGYLASLLVKFVGWLLVLAVQILLTVAQYNQFISSTAVTEGWQVVRDVTNMFFVVYLLLIAIGTITGMQEGKYSWEKTLPKFIMAAILVNFSKTICGLFIDVAQLVMLTFVGAFAGAGSAGPGNFIVMLGIPQLLTLNTAGLSAKDASIPALGLILALVFTAVALMVVVVMIMLLLFRIVTLWFLVVLSPAAFFLENFPPGKTFGDQWWEKFSKEVILGPLLAFFLWLSLTVVAKMTPANEKVAENIHVARELGLNLEQQTEGLGSNAPGNAAVFGTYISSLSGVTGYLLGIAMLLMSLKMATEYSTAGGNTANAMKKTMTNWATGKSGALNPIHWGRSLTSAGFGGLAKGLTSNMKTPAAKLRAFSEAKGSQFADKHINQIPILNSRRDRAAAAGRLKSVEATKLKEEHDSLKAAGRYEELYNRKGSMSNEDIETLQKDPNKKSEVTKLSADLKKLHASATTPEDKLKYNVLRVKVDQQLDVDMQTDTELLKAIATGTKGLDPGKAFAKQTTPISASAATEIAAHISFKNLADVYAQNTDIARQIYDNATAPKQGRIASSPVTSHMSFV